MLSNFYFNFMNMFYFSYFIFIILKYFCLVLTLNMCYYYNFFVDLKNLMVLKFESLMDYTALHLLDVKNDFELNFYILSYKFSYRFLLKLYLKKEDLMMSLNEIFLNSNWFESEMWDMFGMKFMFHSDLSSILTDYGFLGHPLLKYFPLSGFYELSFDEVYNKMIKELMELAQAFRSFSYMNPWGQWYS